MIILLMRIEALRGIKLQCFENDGPLICYKDPCLNYYYYVYYLILLHMYAAGCPSVRTFVFLTF